MSAISFEIVKKIPGALGRAGILHTPHGDIRTPAFAPVATKAAVKAITPEQLKNLGVQIVLGNTYHLHLQPGEKVVEGAGGLAKFMDWSGPSMTDSGGFQAYSLGAAFGKSVGKIARAGDSLSVEAESDPPHKRPAKIDDGGITFRSHIDGSEHRLTPEKSIEIQHALGADIIVAFDEPTSPHSSEAYQKIALARTHRWAQQCLSFHKKSPHAAAQGLLGVIQGGRYKHLREESAAIIGEMNFDGYAIGGSFIKEDIDTAVSWVNKILPEEKYRHLLGIGMPEDFFAGVEAGADAFDCVVPTREGRNGALYTKEGRINILNTKYVRDLSPIESGCDCYACLNFTRSYVTHLFRAKEMLAATLATIHNLRFMVRLMGDIRASILAGRFFEFKEEFLRSYKNSAASSPN